LTDHPEQRRFCQKREEIGSNEMFTVIRSSAVSGPGSMAQIACPSCRSSRRRWKRQRLAG